MARAELAGQAAAPDRRWADFSVRLASAAVLAPVALLALWAGGLAWIAVVAVALAGLGLEWAQLTAPAARLALPALLLASGAAALLLGWPAAFLILGFGGLALAWRYGGWAAAGAPYAGIGGLALLWMRLVPASGFRDVILLLGIVWATDIGAYLVGRLVGGSKMAPRISPGKTWSGAAGGVAFAAAAALALGGARPAVLAAGVLLSVLAQAGDLAESALKRRLGVKDSGRTIPGHGGLFDRLDGLLATAPVAALLILIHGGLPAWT